LDCFTGLFYEGTNNLEITLIGQLMQHIITLRVSKQHDIYFLIAGKVVSQLVNLPEGKKNVNDLTLPFFIADHDSK